MSKYESLGIYELRTLAREIGVRDATIHKKMDLVKKIEEIENGTVKPYIRTSKQGRPPKKTDLQAVKYFLQNFQINKDSSKRMIEEYKLLFTTLKNFNKRMNVLIDNFLNDIDNC